MTTYSIDDTHGNEIASGLSEPVAHHQAQTWANRNEQPCSVYLVSRCREDEDPREHAERLEAAAVTFWPEVSSEQIRALWNEAAAAGDAKQVAICRRALGGDVRAERACASVIFAARA